MPTGTVVNVVNSQPGYAPSRARAAQRAASHTQPDTRAHARKPSAQPLETAAELALEGQGAGAPPRAARSEEHTSELQSLTNLVCRLLLEKKTKGDIKSSLTMSKT